VAAGLLFGRAGLPEFSDAVATAPEVARLRALITLDPDPGMARDAAILRIETRSAEPVEVRVEHTRGSTARPLTDDELQDKVHALVTPILGDGAADRIRKAVDNLPAAADVSGLLTALRPATPVEASHPRRHAPIPAEGTATDRLLALAARPTPTPEAVTALSRFTAAITTQQGIATARTVLRTGAADAAAPAQAGGPALTAWVTGAAASAAPAPDDPTVAMVVCAAAKALGDDCLAAVAAGLAAAAIVESGLNGVTSPGWSVPTVSAAIGAGLAAGVMLGLPEDQLRNALGVCATQAAGLSAAAGTDAGPLQAGKAAFNAFEAALLARVGFTSSAEPLDGRRGLLALFRQG
jgi:2-methylcitrate dehydratase PrpD